MDFIAFVLNHAPALSVAVPLLSAFLIPLFKKEWLKASMAFTLLSLLFTEILVLSVFFSVLSGGTRVYTMGADIPGRTLPSGMSVPVRIILQIDAPSALMGLIGATIALIAAFYALQGVKDKAEGKFYCLMLLMLSGFIGFVFTGDFFNLFVFFEILSISSVGLIAFWLHKQEAIEAGFKYLSISAVASLFVLLAIALMYAQHGVLNIAAISLETAISGFAIIDVIALGLLVAGFLMKCGAVPMHYWVPDAYGEAPEAITAILAVATQASLYALLRVCFTMFGSFELIGIIAWAMILFGVLSLFVGSTMCLLQKDLKRLIAYGGISQTGFILVAMGAGLAAIGNPVFSDFGFKAMQGGIFHMINHAFYEALLFLSAGAVIYAAGTKDLDELGGLARKMPFTAILFLVGAIAMAGLPPSNGFASKILIYESIYYFNPFLAVIALVSSVIVTVPLVKAFCAVFLGPEVKTLSGAREAPKAMLFAMAVLALIVILLGFFPSIVIDFVAKPAAKALLDWGSYWGAVV
ncbi:MAG: proton-conducting transporter membrane subunit [Candidatus Diapherotrites archaeon]